MMTTLPSKTLNDITKVISVSSSWVTDMNKRGKNVAKYRRYQSGEHDQTLSDDMRKMLRIMEDGDTESLTVNYMDVVIQTMVDRLTLTSIDADNDAATEWAQNVLLENRVDSLQSELHEAAIRDADGYLMASWDNDMDDKATGGHVKFTFEEAWDGVTGIIPVYRSANMSKMYAAIKVWQIDSWDETESNTPGGTNKDSVLTRVNVYYPDRIERYGAVNQGGLVPFTGTKDKPVEPMDKWTMKNGDPIGIPIVHFRNRGRGNMGQSEIKSAIAPQNALNRFFYSGIMGAELTAFAMYFAAGFNPGTDVMPGKMIVVSGGAPLQSDQRVEFKKIEASPLDQIISMIELSCKKIGSITRTPAPEFYGAADTASGEALKQHEIGLIGKVERFQTRAGNAWEDAMKLAHRIQQSYGTKQPPAYTRFTASWKSAELRDDTKSIDNALKIKDLVGTRQTMRLLGNVYDDFTEENIDKIMKEQSTDKSGLLGQIMIARGGAFGSGGIGLGNTAMSMSGQNNGQAGANSTQLPTFANFRQPPASQPVAANGNGQRVLPQPVTTNGGQAG